MNKQNILQANNIYKIFGSGDNQVNAVSGVSLCVKDGEFLVIVGSSGSGKSTLLNLLGGMDKVNKGEIFVAGKNICKFNDNELTKYRKDNIGFVFQSFNLINELTAYENIALIADTSKNRDIVYESLESVGLLDKKDKYPSQLSGGEQQRVSIARALSKDTQILFCDEPTGALDYETGKKILSEIEKICRQKMKTVVLVTHTREIGKMADRVISMKNGKIISETLNDHICSALEIEW